MRKGRMEPLAIHTETKNAHLTNSQFQLQCGPKRNRREAPERSGLHDLLLGLLHMTQKHQP